VGLAQLELCIVRDEPTALRIVERLQSAGFSSSGRMLAM